MSSRLCWRARDSGAKVVAEAREGADLWPSQMRALSGGGLKAEQIVGANFRRQPARSGSAAKLSAAGPASRMDLSVKLSCCAICSAVHLFEPARRQR